MKKILVSGCLYGWIVRYDGGDTSCEEPLFLKWKEEGRLVPVCSEILGGLTVPRSPCQRNKDRIVNELGEDVTSEFTKGAEETVRIAKEQDVVCCIMKQRSPSCGSKVIYDGTFSGRRIPGQGIAVELLRNAGFPVFDETELDKVEDLLRQEDEGKNTD